MWPTNWTRNAEDLKDLLDRWRGTRGQVWEYSASHGQLLVRLFREGDDPIPSAYVLCKNCRSVEFETEWKDSDVRVSVTVGPSGPIYSVTDGGRLRVSCGGAFGAESNEFIAIQDATG
jgi:hypothetical protein